MARSFSELTKDFPPERLERIARRKKELEEEMGVRRIDLTTDVVEYDSSKDGEGVNLTPDWERQREEPQPLPRTEEHRYEPVDLEKIGKLIDDAIAEMSAEELEELRRSLKIGQKDQ